MISNKPIQRGVRPTEAGFDESNAVSALANIEATIMNAPVPATDIGQAGSQPGADDAIDRLWAAIENHLRSRAPLPQRTARLVGAGEPKMAQKLIEEAGEVAVAAMARDRAEVVHESADLVYHLTILWARLGIRPEEVWQEMRAREEAYGLAEKRAKPRHGI
jgi:phosphoribosyl-ATP pyrophosphohydrolase